MNNDKLRELLAAIEHERWADWQKWCHQVLRENNPSPEIGDVLERWDRQIETPYADLSDSEKASDMEQVDRYWPLIQEIMDAKNSAYHERNLLVSALTKVFPAWLGYHDGKDWEDDWRTIVYVKLPTGQVSWHIHDDEKPLFEHLFPGLEEWDGHTTDEKYDRLARLPLGHGQQPFPNPALNLASTSAA